MNFRDHHMNFRDKKPVAYSEWLPWVLVLLLTAFLLGLMGGCATTPKTPVQDVYALGWAVNGAGASIADLHASHTLTDAQYAKAKDIWQQAYASWKVARDSVVRQDAPAKTADYIYAVQLILTQLAAYLQSQGVSQ